MTSSWERFKDYYLACPSIGLAVDISRMDFDAGFFAAVEPRIQAAFDEMEALEKGAIANPDEKRMVGHYWLRAPALAPTPEIRAAIEGTVARVAAFARDVHSGAIGGAAGHFRHLLVVGIGGSALGPQLAAAALGGTRDRLRVSFFDNTDPDGIDRVLDGLDGLLGETLVVVISKSGGTKETRNGMVEADAAYRAAGLSFARHAVAVTGAGSELDKLAEGDGWLARFPMWDWVGGRTSETSAVGLLPAALQGLDIGAILAGAAAADEVTRTRETRRNPAALLALMWHFATGGRGQKDMVVLPYRDRLELMSRYLQQLVMESLGKERDRAGNVVHQGIAVYGNKGSTDQHAYVQQLREGVPNFFVTFIEVLRDRDGKSIDVEDGATSGDFLSGFLMGTRRALHENGRQSITLTLDGLDARALGTLIAVYERAVGLYGALVNVNAYHQPGVEAGKKAASSVLVLQRRALQALNERGRAMTADEVAAALDARADTETLWKILEHAAANPDHRLVRTPGATPFDAAYAIAP
ncbi:MAG TPA: glucose-6-phosphate isomerase [Haliangiales bacterium]|nr:glucose-6-phosphate isomerase [Haliangiales bacterium]